jgi:universal stress protein A
MITLKRILAPTDFSASSAIALKYARTFAETFGASLDVLHVMEEPLMYAATPSDSVLPIAMVEALERNARAQLAAVFPEEARKGLRVELVLKKGSPFVEIIRHARENEVDLIILGTHGRGPIAHMLMGGVAEKVVRKAPCPVLTVRDPEHEFVMP